MFNDDDDVKKLLTPSHQQTESHGLISKIIQLYKSHINFIKTNLTQDAKPERIIYTDKRQEQCKMNVPGGKL